MKNIVSYTKRRAAYFLARPDYFGRPLDDGVIRALLKADFMVDVFVPGEVCQQTIYPSDVNLLQVRLPDWLALEHINPGRWRNTICFWELVICPWHLQGFLPESRWDQLSQCATRFTWSVRGLQCVTGNFEQNGHEKIQVYHNSWFVPH